MRVFIVGAGTMGAGIAQTFVQHGHEVWLYDTVEAAVQSGLKKIEMGLQHFVERGQATTGEVQKWLASIHTATALEAASEADLIVEAIFENIHVKQELFQELDVICPPQTYFATNTMALSITEISYGLEHADRTCGMHFFNPAPETELVEVVPGFLTSPETVAAIHEIAHSIGKETVTVKECPGFIVNRLVVSQINEAIFLLMEGGTTAEEIDRAMVLGAGLPCGPLELSDRMGNDNVLQMLENLQEETGDDRYRPCLLLKKMVRAGLLGQKTGQGFFKYEA